ncbi:MAG: A/G-specific adenine glycosylase [Verrucomicrobiota bacterium]
MPPLRTNLKTGTTRVRPLLEGQNAKIRKLVSLQLHWFARNARDLPWRRTTDPYAIWISEIMLQQTQVKTVIPFWERWMRELPTIQALAMASSEKIHKLWEGLGYYTRVRNMQKAAQFIIAEHNGTFPRRFEDVLALSGIGRYTAGAICSIAFNQPQPILDGNVIRVLTRVFAIGENPRDKETNFRLWQVAEALVLNASQHSDHASPCSHLNQSLMELGALICSPRSPQCTECPLMDQCLAFQQNSVERFPNLGKRTEITERRFAAFVLKQHRRILVRQRPAGVVNAHLWEFPNIELESATDPKIAAENFLGFAPKSLKPLCRIRHSITRYRITLEAFVVDTLPKSFLTASPGVWLTGAELKQLSFPSAHKKILTRVAADS